MYKYVLNWFKENNKEKLGKRKPFSKINTTKIFTQKTAVIKPLILSGKEGIKLTGIEQILK